MSLYQHTPVARASEGLTHWYDMTGAPRYTIVGANGKERPTTLRDARKHGWCPSVTQIINCADKPGLNRWKLDQMLHAALTLPRGSTEPEAEWISRVWKDSQETAKKAAERGTAIHAAIQGAYEGGAYEGEAYPAETYIHIAGAMKVIDGWLHSVWIPERFVWVPERSFSSPLGFGGKVDLSHSWAESDHPEAVIDFKTKEFSSASALKTWDEHAMQLAAYREGLAMPKARAAIVYVSVTVPGLSRLIEIPEEELQRGWECFKSLLSYWQAKNKYRPQ